MSRRWNLPLLLGLAMAVALIAAIVVPWVAPVGDPDRLTSMIKVDGKLVLPPFAPGQAGMLLGSDQGGRDLLVRIVYGARTTVLYALLITLVRVALALPLGLLAGWYKGWLAGLTRVMVTATNGVPGPVIVTVVLGGLGGFVQGSGWLALYCVAVAAIGFPRLAEQVRRLTEETAKRPYIEAAVATGAPVRRVLWRHILPVISGDVMVSVATEMGWVLLIMGQLAIFGINLGGTVRLSFDGRPPIILEKVPEWGQMLGMNRSLVRTHPWVPLYPAVALAMTVACLQFLAEGLRRRWLRRG
ncbi:MAG: oligopeptide transporter permease protein [Symbiobacteriaceae bacterium]|nr:oligopeptide transporter permease protein [Symbiobacteriaceae bacterium]